MHSHLTFRLFTLTLVAFLAGTLVSSCKPVGGDSMTYGADDKEQTWRVKTTVLNTGALTLEKNDVGATADAATITDVETDVVAMTQGTTLSLSGALVEKKYFALPLKDNAALKFDVLMKTKGLGTCYVKEVQLNGTNDLPKCTEKTETAPNAGPNDPLVVEMRELCKGFAKLPIDAAKPTEFFASFDEKVNNEKCTCLNGKKRDLFYEVFLITRTNAKKYFEDSCKMALLATDTSTDTSTATTYVDFQKTQPKGAGSGSGSGSGSGTGAGSGAGVGTGSGSASGTTPPPGPATTPAKDFGGEQL